MNDDFQLSRRSVRRSFEHAASAYDEAAVLQREVADRLLERLDVVRLRPERVLDAGAGTGYGTAALARRYPKARVIALDIAQSMLGHARARFGFFARRFKGHRFICGDVERLPLAEASVDLIVSNLTVQWCSPPDVAFAEFRRVLRPGGLLMFTTFGPDTLRELRAAWAAADEEIHVNRFLDMHHVGDALASAGFAEPVMDREDIVVTYGEVERLLRDLKSIGAHNVNAGRARGLTGTRRYGAMRAAYERQRREGVLPATYEIIYGHAWAPQKKTVRPGAGGQVAISLDALKADLKRGRS